MSDEQATYLFSSIGGVDLFLLAVAAIWVFLLVRRGARRLLWSVIGIACVVLVGTDVFALVRRPVPELPALALLWGFVEMPVFFALLVTLPSLLVVTLVMITRHFLRTRGPGSPAAA